MAQNKISSDNRPLVVLESPHKCISVKKYTNNTYNAAATVGHIKDLPKDSISIREDTEGRIDYASIKFVPLPDKIKVIKGLKEAASGRDVFLATDPDREGESIAYDVYGEIKRLAKSIARIEIHQITEKGIKDALKAPRQINLKTVEAQRARRLIDRLVGYKLTKYAASGLGTSTWAEASVGRTQSAALKMVFDRDKEIENFIPQPYWKIQITDKEGTVFSSRIFNEETEALALLDHIKKNGAFIKDVNRKVQSEGPPKPLTASTLQQKANKRFGYSPKKTMSLAQDLYGDGYITYMRTDSVRLAPETQALAKKYLEQCFADIVPPKPPVHMNRGGNTQDAHEAIHPTEISRSGEPAKFKGILSPDQFNLYSMIWDYFMASQSASAEWNTCKVSAGSKGTNEVLTASGKTLLKKGWRTFLGNSPEAEIKKNEDEQESKAIFNYKEQSKVSGSIGSKKDFTKPPAYYTMETFLTALEKNSIGRPATWATICETIINRNYVLEDKKNIKHTPKGAAMVEWLMDVCPQIADIKFTALMEEDLQAIEEGREKQENVVNLLNGVLNKSIERAKKIPNGKYHYPGVDYSNKSFAGGRSYSGSKGSYGKNTYGKSGYSKGSYSKSSSYKKPGSKSMGNTRKSQSGPEL